MSLAAGHWSGCPPAYISPLVSRLCYNPRRAPPGRCDGASGEGVASFGAVESTIRRRRPVSQSFDASRSVTSTTDDRVAAYGPRCRPHLGVDGLPERGAVDRLAEAVCRRWSGGTIETMRGGEASNIIVSG